MPSHAVTGNPLRKKTDMAWRRSRNGWSDPLLHTPAWRRVIRPYWKRRRLPCQCGCWPPRPIDYDGPTYVVVNGKRRLNPAALVIGHVVSRYEAKRLGWSAEQINALSNTRPERQDHSLRSGGVLGAQIQQGWQLPPPPVTPPDTASRW
jgi:hypothetical protein